MKTIKENDRYGILLAMIGEILRNSRQRAFHAINSELLYAKWEIGKHIIEFEQNGSEKADYGSNLLNKLAKDLTYKFGNGFSRRSISDMRRFYANYPIWQTMSAKLSWSHYVELIGIKDDLERKFYENQCLLENWNVRELKRQKDSSLFQRLALSKDKEGVYDLAKHGQLLNNENSIIKDPYVLEFLELPDNLIVTEKELEQRIMDNLQSFILELGKGFSFVGRQYRITVSNNHYYVDLVFYHRLLRCFVLIDLKTHKIDHSDIGQMNMYLGYFNKEETLENENPPIGIILAKEKDEILVEYATDGISNKLFVSEYQLYFPEKKLLEYKLNQLLTSDSQSV